MATPSSDAIPPISASDPDAVAVPGPLHDPEPREREPSALDESAADLPALAGSTSGEHPIDPVSGSATFAVPPGLIAPDPIVRALSESAPASESARLGAAGPKAPVSSSTASGDPLGALRLDLATPAPAEPPAGPAKPAGSSREDVEIEYVNGPNWPMVLLASYASAVTLALIWWVVLPRLRGGSGDEAAPPPPAADVVAERRADRSRKVEPPAPIPAERVTAIGKPLKVGSLEVTPLGVARGNVQIRRAGLAGRVETKDGGRGAMALRLRLRNTSGDAVFAPLDEAFVRERDDGLAESFVELDGGERVYLYPLPVASEWTIVGQDFPDLKPGEAKETRLVTAADFPPAPSGMTWRIKLRTGLDETATIGVRVTGRE